MKFEIKREEIIDALSIGGQMAGKAKTVPVLEFAKVLVQGPEFIVSSFNLETSITKYGTTISADDHASFMVNADELLKAVRAIEDDTVVCEVNSSTLSVKHKSGLMTMAIYDSKSYPEVIEGDALKKNSYDVDANVLKEWLTVGANFVSKDDFRPTLKGMLIYAKNGVMGCCATDAHKLYTDSEQTPFNSEFEAVLPASAIRPLLSVINNNGNDSIQMDVDDKNFTFLLNGCTLVCRITEGVYPNFSAIIPKENNTFVTTSTNDVLNSIRRASMFANKVTSQVNITIGGDKMLLACSDMDFTKQATEKVNVSHIGDSFVIGAKADYFSICLSSIFSDKVTITFKDKFKPMVFKDDMRPNKTILLMPMLVSEN